MSAEQEIQSVMQCAVDVVKSRNNGELPADDLFIYLAKEIVARDRTIEEAGQLNAKKISDQLDMDSRRREVALRAEVEYLTTQGAALKKCLEGRNRDASVLRKLHEEQLAPAINFEMIQAEDAADVLIAESTQF